MKIAVLHDYADVFRKTPAYQKLEGHEVVIHTDAYQDPDRVVDQVKGCDAVLLTQQRVPVTASRSSTRACTGAPSTGCSPGPRGSRSTS